MLTALLAIGCIVCGIGWLKWYISCCALTYYIEKQGYTLPAVEQMEECTQFVAEHLFKKK